MSAMWEVKLGIGIGDLRFGQSEDDTNSIAEKYGGAPTRIDEENASKAIIAQLEQDAVSMPELRPIIEQMKAQSKGKVTVGRGKAAPLLTFLHGKLADIGLDWQCQPAHIGGIKLLPASLSDIAAIANEPALVNDNSVVFVGAGLALLNFAQFGSDGSNDLAKYDNDERYVNLFPSGNFQHVLDGYTKHVFQR